jgi:hypothetical protein
MNMMHTIGLMLAALLLGPLESANPARFFFLAILVNLLLPETCDDLLDAFDRADDRAADFYAGWTDLDGGACQWNAYQQDGSGCAGRDDYARELPG